MCISILVRYATLTQWRISLRIWKFEIRGKFAENDMIGLEKYWKKWGLTNGNEFLRISYEPYDYLTINLPNFLRFLCECYAECLRMPLRILQMLANALRMKRLHNACANCITPCQCFALSLIRQPPPSQLFLHISFANFCSHTNASKSLQMSYDHYKCLAINKNALPSIRMPCHQ